MEWDILRDVLVRLFLSPPAGTFPASSGSPVSSPAGGSKRGHEAEIDLDSVDHLISELQLERVHIHPQHDSQLTLAEVDSHPLCSVLSLPLQELFAMRQEGVGWWCSCVIDAYLQELRAAQSGDGEGNGEGRGRKKPRLCELCERPMPLTAHHLYPRSEHSRLLKRTQLTKSQLQHTLAWLCRPCHSAVHTLMDAQTLAAEYESVEKLRGHEGVQRWVGWAERQRVVGRGMRTAR